MAEAVLATELQLRTTGTVAAVNDLQSVAAASRTMNQGVVAGVDSFGKMERVMFKLAGGNMELRLLFGAVSEAAHAAESGNNFFKALGNTLLTGGLTAGAVASFKLLEGSINEVIETYDKLGYKHMSTWQVLKGSVGLYKPEVDPVATAEYRTGEQSKYVKKVMAELNPEPLESWALRHAENYWQTHHVQIPARVLFADIKEKQKELEATKLIAKMDLQISDAQLKGVHDRVAEAVKAEIKLSRDLGVAPDSHAIEVSRRSQWDKAFQFEPESPMEKTKNWFQENAAIDPGKVASAKYEAQLKFSDWQKQFETKTSGTRINPQTGNFEKEYAYPKGVDPEKIRRTFEQEAVEKAINSAMPTAEKAFSRFIDESVTRGVATGKTDWVSKLLQQYRDEGRLPELGKTPAEQMQSAQRLADTSDAKLAHDVDIGQREGQRDFLSEYIQELKRSGRWESSSLGDTEEQKRATAKGELSQLEATANFRVERERNWNEAVQRDRLSPQLAGAATAGSVEDYRSRIQPLLQNQLGGGKDDEQVNKLREISTYNKEMADGIRKLANSESIAVVSLSG